MWDDQTKKRLECLKGLLQRLDAGENVAPRDLKQWLSKEQIQAWKNETQQIRDFDDEWQTRPSEFDDYLALLKKADFAFSKGDKISAKASVARTKASPSASSLINSSQGYFERAIEKLHEILGSTPALSVWLDRPVDEAGIDPVSIPRLKTSKAHHAKNKTKLGQPLYKSIKRKEFHDAKRRAVADAIEEIENPQPPVQNTAPELTLAEKLQRLKSLTGR